MNESLCTVFNSLLCKSSYEVLIYLLVFKILTLPVIPIRGWIVITNKYRLVSISSP